ncbi:MAG: branched-chain amino acid ABC transporter permease [Enhydrobacter sp.]|nr:branched-chain amino acid ABC transporter permease [Enhydrobacter sp.]
MSEDMGFFFALVLNGISIGLMYSLIALGFVLVYKATDAINFAQGEFVMMAALIGAVVAGFQGSPVMLAIAAVLATLAVMIGFGFGLERVVLRPLLGRPIVAVIMATIGLAAMLRGLTPIVFGGQTRALPLPIGDEPITIGPASLPPIQVLGAGAAILLFLAFSWFFKKSRMGVAMRAVADNQQVAQAMGINVERYFALAWAMGGIVAALSGIVWGSMLGVDVQIAVVGLKVFPVVILGGLDSIGGALVGGLIVGLVESLASGYLDPYVGGGTKDFAPYVLMILFLMFRPYGIFGKRQIERV